jgi:alkaline phosphatase
MLADASYPSQVTCGSAPNLQGTVMLPKNIIFVMGDGMGPVQLIAGAVANGAPLELTALSEAVYFNTDSLTTDRAEVADDEPTDSAAGATAFATGTRTLNGRVGRDVDGNDLETIADLAVSSGKSFGIVTTSYVYDASPAAFYAHATDRDDYATIVGALVDDAQPDLVFGGGRALFEADDGSYLSRARAAGYTIVWDAEELAAWDPVTTPKVLGLFQGSAFSEAPNLWEWWTTPVTLRDATSLDPSLPEMTRRALDRLGLDDDGFLLFVENEHIDTMGHIALIKRDLVTAGLPLEVAELDATVRVALEWIEANSSFEDTLLIVTADHETGGYLIDDGIDSPLFLASPFHTRLPVAAYAAGANADRVAFACRGADLFHAMTGRLSAP